MNMLVALSLFLAQDNPVDEAIRKLGSDRLEERVSAEEELLRRGRSEMAAWLKELGETRDAARKRRLRESLAAMAKRSGFDPAELAAITVTCETGGKRLDTAAAELAELARVPITVVDKPGKNLTLGAMAFKDAPLTKVLDALAASIGGQWYEDGKCLFIAPPTGLPVRLFPVDDLTFGIVPETPFPPAAQGRLPAFGMEECVQPTTGADLANLIKTTVHPDGWDELQGKVIQFQNGVLIIRNSAQVGLDVEKKLADLRAATFRSFRVAVEAYALRPGAGEGAAEARKEGRLLGTFERTTFGHRRLSVGLLDRRTFVSGYDAKGSPVLQDLTLGPCFNVDLIAPPRNGQATLVVEGVFSRLLRMELRKTDQGDVQAPEIAREAFKVEEKVKAGEWTVMTRLRDTRYADGLPTLVVLARVEE